ncbi:MAG: rhamnulokinase, partial [Bacteroidales bacterium]|nr:rhamnulokinase [Bacteroidales bacterium]
MEAHRFLAFDLGATSGRAMLGTLSDRGLQLEEVHRFPNRIVEYGGHLHWDLEALFREVCQGLKKAAATGLPIDSVGIDTWGVDVAFFDADGRVIAPPYCYRDPQTVGAADRFMAEKVERDALYARTGIQVMDFNTLFQLDTLQRRQAPELAAAEHILFLPDALTCLLTGTMVTEYTIASTSHFLDPVRGRLDPELLAAVGVDPARFAPMVQPGSVAGLLKPEIAQECGLPQIPVVSV